MRTLKKHSQPAVFFCFRLMLRLRRSASFPLRPRRAPHFLPPRNGGKNREGPGPFEPRALFSTLGLRPLSPVTAGQICADAQDWPAGGGNTSKLAWGIILMFSVRWGTVLRRFADNAKLLKRNFPGEARKIMLQTMCWCRPVHESLRPRRAPTFFAKRK